MGIRLKSEADITIAARCYIVSECLDMLGRGSFGGGLLFCIVISIGRYAAASCKIGHSAVVSNGGSTAIIPYCHYLILLVT